MTRGRCWGVYRELAHSPGRETDDAEILRATARELTALGFDVELRSPDELEVETDAVPQNVFVMCERIPVVERLSSWERRGARIVNRPSGIRNTDRERTLALFRRHEVPFPESTLVSTAPDDARFPGACWVKRADVHATEAGDVSFAGSPQDLAASLERLRGRGIARAVVQHHVPGDLIKFYGVGGGGGADGGPAWFRWFYHKDQKLVRHPFEPARLARLVRAAATALGLEVYGGDAIASGAGSLVLLDVNAWPSFALYRDEAAPVIADYLALRFAAPRGRDRAPR